MNEPTPIAQPVPFNKDSQVMFFVFMRQKGSQWIEGESSENRDEVLYWVKRNNARSAATYEPGCGREYVAVKRVATFKEVL